MSAWDQLATNVDPFCDRPLRILTLDGGGCQGLSCLIILRKITSQVALSLGVNPSQVLPCNYFDLICGSGTGGVIALLLGPLQMSVDDAIDVYSEIAQETFGRPADRVLFKWFPCLRKFFKPTNSERQANRAERLEESTRSVTLRVGQPLTHNGRHNCIAAVTAADSTTGGALVLIRYVTGEASDYAIWEAARATTASVGLFPPFQARNGNSYHDIGDTDRSNPTRIAIAEAELRWPSREIGLVISLGTGAQIALQSPSNTTEPRHSAAIRLAENCRQTHRHVTRSQADRGVPQSYFRFDVDGGLEANEWSDVDGNQDKVISITEGWMRSTEVETALGNCRERFLAIEQWSPASLPNTPIMRPRSLSPRSYHSFSMPVTLEPAEDLSISTGVAGAAEPHSPFDVRSLPTNTAQTGALGLIDLQAPDFTATSDLVNGVDGEETGDFFPTTDGNPSIPPPPPYPVTTSREPLASPYQSTRMGSDVRSESVSNSASHNSPPLDRDKVDSVHSTTPPPKRVSPSGSFSSST